MWFAGFNVDVDIVKGSTTTAFTVQRVMVRDAVPPQNVSNSEGVPGNPAAGANNAAFQAMIGGESGATIELTQPTFNDTLNPYATPLSLVPGDWIGLLVWPAGRGVTGSDDLAFGSVLITEIELNADVTALEPLTIRGVSDGPYNAPGGVPGRRGGKDTRKGLPRAVAAGEG